MEKLDFKKQYKDLYSPSAKHVSLVEVPNLNFLMIDGKGDPNGEDFGKAVEALCSLCYTIKFWTKKHPAPPGFVDFGVAPLEGLWSVEGEDLGADNFSTPREKWLWTIMIMQPDFVSEEFFDEVRTEVSTKKPNPYLQDVRLEHFCEGRSVQIMHLGPYSTEPESIAKIVDYMNAHGLTSNGRHHEIYLSDPRRSAPDKLRTILRHPVK